MKQVIGRRKLFLARWMANCRQMGWHPLLMIALAIAACGSVNELVAGHNRFLFTPIVLAAAAGCAMSFRRCVRRSPLAYLILPTLRVQLFSSMHGWALAIGAASFVAVIVFGYSERPDRAK